MTGVVEVTGVVGVLPDVSGIDRVFSYAVPPELAGRVRVGTIVRVRLHGRRVRGWAVEAGGSVPVGGGPGGVELQPVLEVVSEGPPDEVVALCRFGAWRWAGRLRPLLLAASPERVVRSPLGPGAGGPAARSVPADGQPLVAHALGLGDAVFRLPPLSPRLPVVLAALSWAAARSGGTGVGRGPGAAPVVLVESREDARRLARQLGASGIRAGVLPEDWAAVARGGLVAVGPRNAVFAPVEPSLLVVLDAHSEAYRSERVPSFDARVLAAERARRAGVPVLFVTPCPSLDLLAHRPVVTVPRSAERQGWGHVGVLDTGSEDPGQGGYPSELARLVHRALAAGGAGSSRAAPVAVVLNRTGRARLLGCSSCRAVQRCEACGGAVVQRDRPAKGEVGVLSCPRCGAERPALCPACGSARLRIIRPGVSRAREQLEALLGVEVGEVAGPRPGAGGALAAGVPGSPVVIGTEAVLHRLGRASLVVFLDFDQELLAPRFRAAEQALVLVARALRLVARRQEGGLAQVVLRTSMPDHEVVQAAQRGDPSLVEAAERERRVLLRLPPERAVALLTSDGEASLDVGGLGPGVSVAPMGEGRFVVSAGDSATLADSLGRLAAASPAGWAGVPFRVEVDPVDF